MSTAEPHDPKARPPSRDPASAKPFVGLWRITEMELWAQDAVETLGPGFFQFGSSGGGSFRFICVEGDMSCRFAKNKKGHPIVRFSWTGFDEFTPTGGRGWAVAKGEKLQGRIYLHDGDDSSFKATRTDEAIDTHSQRPRRKWR